MMVDTLANAMASIKNAEMKGKRECVIYPASNLIASVLNIMQKHGYIDGYEFVNDGRGGKFVVKLNGRINDCGVVKPRFSVKKDGCAEWERQYLPSRDIGILIVSTPSGVMSHREAREKGVGGVLLAYVY
ncbi:MAG: 30S ribosomal protein S8 [Thermofilum sp.]